MIWTLILHYQIGMLDLLNNNSGEKGNARDKIMQYCQDLVKNFPVEVKNLTTSFSDGGVLACMCYAKKPESLDPNKILNNKEDKKTNVEELLKLLEETFQVPHVLDTEDITEEPDEKAMMTFLSYVIQALEKHPTVATSLSASAPAPETAPIVEKPPRLDTIPNRVLSCAEEDTENSSKLAYMFKNATGEWDKVSWKEYAEEVRRVSKSLIAEGVNKGERVAIIGKADPSWSTFYVATQAIGAVPVGIYDNFPYSKLKEIVELTEPKIACVGGDKELEKLRPIFPSPKKVVLFKSFVGKPTDGNVLEWNPFLQSGDDVENKRVEERLEEVKGEDAAVLVCSPATGKLATLSHNNLASTSKKASQEAFNLKSEDTLLASLPLSHISQQLQTILIPSETKSKVCYAHSSSDSPFSENLKQVEPTFVLAPSHFWEDLYKQLSAKVPPSQLPQISSEKKGEALHQVGLSKANSLYSFSSPISKKILSYFDSLGKPLFELYGQTESTGLITLNKPEAHKMGTVGKSGMVGLDLEIGEGEEILVKGGENVFKGYHNDPKSTEETLKEGLLHTGDVGEFDGEGFLVVKGKKEEMIVTEGGKKVNPFDIEAALRLHPFVNFAAVFGNNKKFLTALLSPDMEAISSYCNSKSSNVQDLLKSEELNNSIQEHINSVNSNLSKEEKIKKFKLVDVPFSVEGGELTPTFNCKREAIGQKYDKEIDALYRVPLPQFDSVVGSLAKYASQNEEKDAYFFKNGDQWESVNWSKYYNDVQDVSKSLLANGVENGEKVVLIGKSSPKLATAYLASQFIGAVPVCLFPQTRAEEICLVVKQTKASIVFVANDHFVHVLEKNKNSLPSLKKVISLEEGDKKAKGEQVSSFSHFLSSGENVEESKLEERLLSLHPNSPAALIYQHLGSSKPKPVQVSHSALYNSSSKLAELSNSNQHTKYFSLTPLAQLSEQIFAICVPICSGSKVYFGEEQEDVKQVQPNIFLSPKKNWKKLKLQISELSSLDTAEKVKSLSKSEKEKLRESFGLKDCCFAVCNDGSLAKEDEDFFEQLECPLLSSFGQVEAGGPITFSSPQERRPQREGKPLNGNQIKISNKDESGKGEVLFKSPSLTSSQLDSEGFLNTQQVGEIDSEGFLKVHGPKKEQLLLENGTIVDPRDIEEELERHPFVEHALVLADNKKKFLLALLSPDLQQIRKFASQQNKSGEEFLSSEDFKEEVKQHVDSVNQMFSTSDRVEKYKLLAVPLSLLPDAELSPEGEINKDVVLKTRQSEIEMLETPSDVQTIDGKVAKHLVRLKKHLNVIAFRVPIDLEKELGEDFVSKHALDRKELEEGEEETVEQVSEQFIDICEKRTSAIDTIVDTLQVKIEGANNELSTERERNKQFEETTSMANQKLEGLLQNLENMNEELNNLKAKNEQVTKEMEEIQLKLPLQLRSGVPTVPPPTGVVTLVFTDVQSSTAQWEENPKTMASGLSVHNDLMRKHIHECKGYEVKTEGDAFMIAFSSTLDAAKWCLRVQEALVEADWPEELLNNEASRVEKDSEGKVIWRGLRVRMGIHSGEPTAQQDPVSGRMDYFGRMVNRAARVEGKANGGQVLISEDAFKAIEESLSQLGDPIVTELGEFELKGLEKKEFLRQLTPLSLRERKFPEPPNEEDKAKQKMEELQNKLKSLQEENQALINRMSELEKNASATMKEANELATTIALLQDAPQSDSKTLKRALEKVKELKEKQNVMNQNLSESKNQNLLIIKSLQMLTVQLVQMKEENKKLEDLVSRASDENLLLEKQTSNLAKEKHNQAKQLELEKEKTQDLLQQLTEAQEKIEKDSLQRKLLLEKIEKLENSSGSSLESEKELRKEKEELERKMKELQETLLLLQNSGEELKEKNASLFQSQAEEVEKMKNALEERKKENSNLLEKLSLLEEMLTKLREEKEESEKEREKLKEENEKLEKSLLKSLEMCEQVEKEGEEKRAEMSQQLEELKAKLEEVHKCSEECHNGKQSLREENEQLRRELEELRNAKPTVVAPSILPLDSTLASLHKQLKQSQQSVEQLPSQLKLSSEESEALGELGKALKEAKLRTEELLDSSLDLQNAKSDTEIKASVELMQNEQKQMEEASSQLNSIVEETNKSQDSLKEKMEEMKKLIKNCEEEIDESEQKAIPEGADDSANRNKRELLRKGVQVLRENLEKCQEELHNLQKPTNTTLDTLESEIENSEPSLIETEEDAKNAMEDLNKKIQKQISDCNEEVKRLEEKSRVFKSDPKIEQHISLYNALSKDLDSLSGKIMNTLKIKTAQQFVFDAYTGYENLLLQFQKKLVELPFEHLLNKPRWVRIRKLYVAIISNRISRWQCQKKLFPHKQQPSLPPSPAPAPVPPSPSTPVNPREVISFSPSVKIDEIDEEVSKIVRQLGLNVPVKKLQSGQYLIGSKKLNLKILSGLFASFRFYSSFQPLNLHPFFFLPALW